MVRLVVMVEEGGVYSDIDRLWSAPLKDIMEESAECILPINGRWDFSQDVMIAAPGEVHRRALRESLARLRAGRSVLNVGPQANFDAICEELVGGVPPGTGSGLLWRPLRTVPSRPLSRTWSSAPRLDVVRARYLSLTKRPSRRHRMCGPSYWSRTPRNRGRTGNAHSLSSVPPPPPPRGCAHSNGSLQRTCGSRAVAARLSSRPSPLPWQRNAPSLPRRGKVRRMRLECASPVSVCRARRWC